MVVRRKYQVEHSIGPGGSVTALLDRPMALASCEVLGCKNPAAHPIRLCPYVAPIVEGLVCEEHRARIEAGVPVRWDPDPADGTDRALVMGTDLEAAGLTITDVIALEEHGLVLAPDGSPAVTLVLEKLNTDAGREEVRLTMSYEVMDQLGSIFEAYWRRSPVGPPQPDR